MQLIEKPDTPTADIVLAVATLQTDVIPRLEAIINEGANQMNGDMLYVVNAKEQLLRAVEARKKALSRLGGKATAA